MLVSSQYSVPYVRWGELGVASAQFADLKTAAIENIQSTLAKEDGVLEFHAICKREHPDEVLVFEVYKDREVYGAHVQSPHYKQFGASVGPIIKRKALHDTIPVFLARRQLMPDTAYVRIAELEIELNRLDEYKTAVTEEIDASLRSEPDVLAIYSVALKDSPAQLRFLEFYANEQAYLQHRESPHFQNYLSITKPMIKSLTISEGESIMLGFRCVEG